jgi:hypothetical protein
MGRKSKVLRWSFVLAVSMWICLAQTAHAEDGVLEINQACAKGSRWYFWQRGGCFSGDGPGFPVTITRPGSYRLTSDLTPPDQNTDVIQITATEGMVRLDMNGFIIQGTASCSPCPVSSCTNTGTGRGIYSTAPLVVQNGQIRGMGAAGIEVSGYLGISGLGILFNGGKGVSVTNGTVDVYRTLIAYNNDDGLNAANRSATANEVISSCNKNEGIEVGNFTGVREAKVTGNGGAGISVGTDSAVTESLVSGNGGYGLVLGSRSGYGGVVATCNRGLCDDPQQVSGGTSVGLNLCAENTSCP